MKDIHDTLLSRSPMTPVYGMSPKSSPSGVLREDFGTKTGTRGNLPLYYSIVYVTYNRKADRIEVLEPETRSQQVHRLKRYRTALVAGCPRRH